MSPSSLVKKIPSDTPSIAVVSVIAKPIKASDCVTSLNLNLHEKKALLLPFIKNDSPLSCNSSESLSASLVVTISWPPAPLVI